MNDEVDKIVALDFGIIPEAAISGGVLLQSETLTFLTFNAVRETADGLLEDAGTAVMEFVGCWRTQFGLPNDEALPGHPLYSKGLTEYGICEVLNSSWVRRLEQQNQVAFPGWTLSNYRHFILLFHDSTFECVARDCGLEVTDDSYEQILARMAARILNK